MIRQILLGLLLLAGLGTGVRAADEATSFDSPKAALRAQDAAAKAGNVDADMDFYLADGEQQMKLAHAIAAGDVAVAKLEKAVGESFGKDLASAAVRAAGCEDARAIAAATEKVEGDHATVQFADSATPVPMVRTDGKWKVSIGEWTKGASASELDQLTSKLDQLAHEIDHVVELVTQNKFRSGEGVRDRVQELHDRLFGGKG